MAFIHRSLKVSMSYAYVQERDVLMKGPPMTHGSVTLLAWRQVVALWEKQTAPLSRDWNRDGWLYRTENLSGTSRDTLLAPQQELIGT